MVKHFLVVAALFLLLTGCAYERGAMTDSDATSYTSCSEYDACTTSSFPDQAYCDGKANNCAHSISTGSDKACYVTKHLEEGIIKKTVASISCSIPEGVNESRFKYCIQQQLREPSSLVSYCKTWAATGASSPPLTTSDSGGSGSGSGGGSGESGSGSGTTGSTASSASSSSASTCSLNQFTGLAASAGYTYSETDADGSSGSGNTAQVGIGYTAGVGCIKMADSSVGTTIGLTITQNIGSMGTSSSTETVGASGTHYDADCHCQVPNTTTSKDKTEIKNTTALTVQPGIVIGDSTQIYVNLGAVVTDKNSSSATGSRVGAGACQSVTDTLSACLEANHDQISGTSVNSAGLSLKTSL